MPPSGTEGHVKRAVVSLAVAGLGPIFEVGVFVCLCLHVTLTPSHVAVTRQVVVLMCPLIL